jgi:hypothetical protein
LLIVKKALFFLLISIIATVPIQNYKELEKKQDGFIPKKWKKSLKNGL